MLSPKSSSDSSQSSFMPSNTEEIGTGLNNNNDLLDNSSIHNTLQLDDNSFALRFYEINSQKSNLENIPSQL